jgi:SAM-dependent methyltransferase
MMLSSQQHRLPQQQLHARQPPKTQEEVTREWDGLAGDWDDLATAAAAVSSLGNVANPNAELFRRCVRPALQQLGRERRNCNEKRGEGGLGKNSSPSGSRRPSLHGDEGAWDDDVSAKQATTTAATDDGEGEGADQRTAVSSTSNHVKRKVRIVDFGCGTGIMIQHIMRWWQQHQKEHQEEQGDDGNSNHNDKDNEPIELEIVGIDASSRMVEMLRDKVQSCGWDCAATPLCCAVARLPPLVLPHPRKNEEEDPSSCSNNSSNSNSKSKIKIKINNSNDESSYDLLQKWVGTADLVVACCALGCVPDDDLDATMKQLSLLLRPHGQGQLVHCEWWEDAVAATGDHGDEGTDGPPHNHRELAGSNGATETDEAPGRRCWGRISGAKGMTVGRAHKIHATRTSFSRLESVAMDVVRYGASNHCGDAPAGGMLFGVARTAKDGPAAPTTTCTPVQE